MIEAPFALMIAGPNGSGKTTLTRELQARGVDFGEYINPYDIALSLPGSYAEQVRTAQARADERRAACLAERRSFSFETVMSHASKVEVLRAAGDRGFRTLLYFVATEDPAINVARVLQRVRLGGHAVPEDRIVARYHRSMSLLPDAMRHAGRTVLFDNSRRPSPGEPVLLRPVLFYDAGQGRTEVDAPCPLWASAALAAVRHLQNDRKPGACP